MRSPSGPISMSLLGVVAVASSFVAVGCATTPPASHVAAPPPPSSTISTAPPRLVFGRTVRVRFAGNRALDDATLRSVIHVDKSLADDASTPPGDLLSRDSLLLTALYYDRGYMYIELGSTSVKESADGPFVDVTFTIQKEGPRIRIRRLTSYERDDGEKKLLDDREVRKWLRPASGDWFSRIVLVEDLQKLRTFYRDRGYANVEATPETEVDEREAVVDIVIPIARGPLVTVESIVVKGNTKTPLERVNAELRIHEGELSNESRMLDTKKRLEELFRRVEVTTEQGTTPSRMKVTFEVVEK